jgi:hypothetical protein
MLNERKRRKLCHFDHRTREKSRGLAATLPLIAWPLHEKGASAHSLSNSLGTMGNEILHFYNLLYSKKT